MNTNCTCAEITPSAGTGGPHYTSCPKYIDTSEPQYQTPQPSPQPITVEQLAMLRHFIGRRQFSAIHEGLRGEEKEFFLSKLKQLAEMIETMPKTYEQDGKGDQAIVYLHYFAGGEANYYITEKDAETYDAPGQHQAFGLAKPFGGDDGEMGYISIVELLANHAELDLYFKPRPLGEILRAV